jgi:integrase
MNEDQKPLQLLQLLNRDEGAAGERLQRWAQAFEAWLAWRRTRFSPSVGLDSYSAWREFLAFTHKPPWQATVPDVDVYVAALTKKRLRPGTIKRRLSGLAQFYKYCQENEIDPQCPPGFNPVVGARPPEEVKYGKANFLSRKEEAVLLETIRQDLSPMGKRDYALFLMLLRTGWKAGEVRRLRWGDLGARLQGSGSGERCLGEGLVEDLWQAVREYLQASGRWETIQPEQYVFAPSRAPLVREARGCAEDWDGSRPLSKDGLYHLLKLHAGRAGLKAGKITCHTLRHTAAMRQVEAGAASQAVRAMLGMGRLRWVKSYLARLAQRPKGRLRAPKPALEEIWPGLPSHLIGEVSRPLIGEACPEPGRRVSRPSHPPGSAQVPSRGPHRALPGSQLALKHGFYARRLPEFEWLAELGFKPKGLDGAVVRWRVVMQRAAILGNHVTTLKEGLKVLKILGMASFRLCKALKLRKELRDEEREREWQVYLRERSE